MAPIQIMITPTTPMITVLPEVVAVTPVIDCPMLRDNLFAANSFARQHFDMKVVERLVDEHETQRVDHSQRLYALLMLELWWRLQ